MAGANPGQFPSRAAVHGNAAGDRKKIGKRLREALPNDPNLYPCGKARLS